MEIGTVVRGSRDAFKRNPCLVTAKETISPLFLDKNAGDVLLALAKRRLPCSIIPMPITGICTPVTKAGNAVVGNAEILGVMTAIKAVYPEALVGGGKISGIMDMKTNIASFSAEQALVDLELCRYIHAHFESNFDLSGLDEIVKVIKDVGIRGNTISKEHTFKHFRENWFPYIMDRGSYLTIEENKRTDLYHNAHAKIEELICGDNFYCIEEEKAREIDAIVKKAEAILS